MSSCGKRKPFFLSPYKPKLGAYHRRMKRLEKNFTLDAHTCIKPDYNPIRDPGLYEFLKRPYTVRILKRAHLLSKSGCYGGVVNTGYLSGIKERVLNIPANIYDKGNNPGMTQMKRVEVLLDFK